MTISSAVLHTFYILNELSQNPREDLLYYFEKLFFYAKQSWVQIMDIKLRIDELKNSKAEQDRRECIPLLEHYLKSHPDDVQSWYDLAGCFDYCGLEKEAEPCYWKTYELGWKKLPAQEQPGFFVGFGSTLRNNLKLDQSEMVLKVALEHFPTYPALKAFLALTQYSKGQFQECAQTLFAAQAEMPANAYDGYENAIKWYVENLETYPPRS